MASRIRLKRVAQTATGFSFRPGSSRRQTAIRRWFHLIDRCDRLGGLDRVRRHGGGEFDSLSNLAGGLQNHEVWAALANEYG